MLLRTYALAFLLLTVHHPGRAQMQRPPDEAPSQFVFLDAATWPDTASGKARIDIRYRIDRGFFVAVRTTDTSASQPFLRTGEILIELFDSTSTSASRKIDRISIPDVTAESDPADPAWYEGTASFSVTPGRYEVFFEATDRQSDRRYVYRAPNSTVRARVADPGSFTLFAVAAIAPVTDLLTARIIPDNVGDDILFGANHQLLAAVTMPDDTTRSVTVEYRISVLEREGHPAPPREADSALVLPVVRGVGLRATQEPGTANYTFVQEPGSRIGYIAVPLRTSRLPLRTYSLELRARAGTAKTTVTMTFRNVWPGMPRSLKNVDGAIDALRLIAAEAAMDSMQSGGFNERRDALERFWAQRDPTPGTIMNEAMTEFYRRVDQARTAYGTMQEPDGLKTDRGRIYVLNGQPTRVDRTLNPSVGYTETWTYEKTRRVFTFVDERRNGNYRLSASQK